MENPANNPGPQSEFSDRGMLRDELETLGPARPKSLGRLAKHLIDGERAEGPYSIGLALSGGGIRSATVSLGIMQKLADARLLQHVDYLSTVSGGGYIGSALTWWLRKRGSSASPYDTGENFPFGTDDPKRPEKPRMGLTPLQFLRSNGNYLTPGNGITFWSGLAIVLRAIFLNLMIWIPVTALVMTLLYLIGRLPFVKGLPFLVRTAAPGSLEAVSDVVGASGSLEVNQTIPPAFLLLMLLAVVLLALFLLGSIGHSLLSWTDRTERDIDDSEVATDGHPPPASGSKWYSWLLVGLVGVVGLAVLVGTILWISGVLEPLFASGGGDGSGSGSGSGSGGGSGLPAVADIPALLPSALWIGYVLWGLAVGVTLLSQWLLNRLARGKTFGMSKQLAIVLGLMFLLLPAIPLARRIDYWGISQRVPEFLQFAFAVCFLTYMYYQVGVLIRHLLRGQSIGSASMRSAAETPSLLQYHARRVFEWFFGGAIMYSIVFIAVGTLPLVNHYIGYQVGGTWAAIGIAITFAGQIWARFGGHGKWTNLLIVVGAIVLTYGVLLIGYDVSRSLVEGSVNQRAVIVAVIIIALIAGWFVNTNHIGLHRYYRDRLMEAFMPDDDQLQSELNKMACGANGFQLAEAWPGKQANGPYHIVNANLVLSKSPTRKYRERAGDNFMLSPLYMGSSATGWHKTQESATRDMTLASAMAISGAAANPRGAAGGRGITRNAAVAIIMSLLNVRLGYWIPNPKSAGRKSILPVRPNHFWPGGIYAIAQRGYTENSKWLELADGGHFENLAIYELVRRRCGLIIVCDGGQDNASSYADLVTAVQRIGSDFGATVHLDMKVTADPGQKSGPARLIAKPGQNDYPKGAEYADKGYFICRIEYSDDEAHRGWPKFGTVIYMKSALIKELELHARGYRGAHPEFPNQSTGDQFFEDEQFEAYREVGYRICQQMIADLKLERLFKDGPPKIKDLRSNAAFKPA